MIDEDIATLVERIVEKELNNNVKNLTIPVSLSNRHVHLSKKDFHRLFGPAAKLEKLKRLSQPGQFATKQTVDLIGPKRVIKKVRVLGPFRNQTQIEISLSDGYVLGINPPIRQSGDIEGTPGIHVMGPRGAIKLDKGVICSARHIHMSPKNAERFNVKDGQHVAVRFPSKRAGILDDIIVRVNPKYELDLHLDLDEGNALGLKTGDRGVLLANFDNTTYSPFR